MTMDEIHVEVKKLDNESKALKKELYKLAWFMRGSLGFEEAHNLDVADREILGEIIKENLETTKASQLPFF
jgi:hypothetical protein